MTRKEMYEVIQKNDLQKKVHDLTGKNYTNATNAELGNVINIFTKLNETSSMPDTEETCVCVTSAEKQVERLLEVLYNKRLLIKSEVGYVLKG